MKKIIATIIVAAIYAFADPISGGFGIKLGDTFDPKQAVKVTKTTSGEPLYGVRPPKKVKYFDQYYVMITPKSHKIREIWGIGRYAKREECMKDFETLSILLSKKYGELKKPAIISMDEILSTSDGDRSVSIRCSGMMSYHLYLKYISEKLNDLAAQERAEMETKKIDTDAL